MAEYKSRKKRWIATPNVLFIALCVFICIPSTKGVCEIDFDDTSVDRWKFLIGASPKQLLYDFCKYNGTSKGEQCHSFGIKQTVDFEKVCGCHIQQNKTIEGSFSFDLDCTSNLSYCPEKLTVTYRQGPNATAPHQVPSRRGIGKNNNESPGNPPGPGTGADPDVATSGINGWLVAFIISFAVNVLTILCIFKEKVYDFLTAMWNRLSNRIMDRGQQLPSFHRHPAPGLATEEEPDIDSTETPLRELTGNTPQVPIPRGSTSAAIEMGEPIESLDVSESDERGDTHIRPEGKANLGFFESEIDGHITKQNADNVCVLVIHYEFKNDPDYFRKGDACDVENLKTSFGKNRNCNFRNLSPDKKFLLQLLGDQEELLQFFNTQGDVPSVFVLFILSRDENGKILTDHLDRETNDYEYFTTDEVFDSLQKLKKFDKCLKIVNFGPCRGSLVDSMFDEKKKNKRYENRRSCRITTRPGTHNYIVFYSTVETTMANTEENGSWFVRNICTCLNYADDESLLKFFTIVQNRMHQASRIFTTFEKNTPLGQTPELKMFTQDRKFIISKLKIPARAISITDGYGEVSKVRNERFSEYFSWKSDEGRDIRGRRGFILSAVKSTQVQDVKRALRMLDFEITDWKLSRPSMDIYFNMVSKLEPDVGCIMTCIFGPVCKNKHKEVCVRVENGQEIPISNILHSLVGPKNDKLIEKPKILFVVNMEALQTDSFSAVDIEDLQVSATNHSGWLVLILKHEDALKELIEIFENIGENSLQELLEPLLTRESKREDVVLLNSTMQYLIKFPNWIRAFVKPDFKFKKTQNQRGQMDNSENSTRNPLAEKINFDALLKMANRMFEENKNSIESHIWSPHVSSDIESSKELDLVRDSAARDRTDTSILWLFNSVAGAGKSTVLKEMRHQLTNHDGGFKILLIPLKENEWYLLEMPALKVDEIEFLAKTTCNSHDDINNWIKKREVIVFLDGFDEVCPNFREEMINILIALNNARVPLFIGTRPHEVHHIQERIENSMAVEIEPLDEEKQNELKQIVAGGGLRQRTRND